jgi:uncharacterized protein YecE (DUF72 family)
LRAATTCTSELSNGMPHQAHIGCAGWNIPKQHAASFPPHGAHLERYARRFDAVEINSSFYKPHRYATYERWARAVPDGFRFAVKAPREITHARRLAYSTSAVDAFLAQVSGLGEKLGPMLFQLPPSLEFDAFVIGRFLADLRARFTGSVVCEPRHASWFSARAESLLSEFRVSRAGADPALVEAAAQPGGWDGLLYHRLHGSPRIYYSPYDPDYLDMMAERLAHAANGNRPCWCIFDNTAMGAAMANALSLSERLAELRGRAAASPSPSRLPPPSSRTIA